LYQEKLRYFEIMLATIFFSRFSRWNTLCNVTCRPDF